jgi:hypothetical protein
VINRGPGSNAAFSPGNLEAQQALLKAINDLEKQLGALSDALIDKNPRNAADAAKKIGGLIDTIKHATPRLDDAALRKKLNDCADVLANIQDTKIVPGVRVSVEL